jgi:uncharacterized protein (TIGR00266 family)
MKYEIKGQPMPVVICQVDPEETMICESGAMSWMSTNMEMQTSGGGIGKVFGRMFSGENMFQNRYTARKTEGLIAFAAKFPGAILAFDITPSTPIICQKRSFLASTSGVDLSVHFQERLGSGFFGGEGFIMQKLSGNGTAFLEIDGTAVEYELQAGQRMVIDTGYLAMMDATCSIEVQTVKGVKNVVFGGESLFNTVVTGPGKIIVQTMPMSHFAGAIARLLPNKG